MRTVSKKTMTDLEVKLERLKALCEGQDDFKSELEAALGEFVENFKDSKGKTYAQYVTEVNEAAESITEQANEVAERIDAYIDDRSAKWADSERGNQYLEWRENWQDFSRNVEHALMSEDISVSLEIGASKGVDDCLEVPLDNVHEIVTSYSGW